MSRPDWFPDWSGETCVIVASGPSALAAGMDRFMIAPRPRIIAVNDSWLLAPFADAVMGCDAAWWRARKGLPDYRGLRVATERVEEYPVHQMPIVGGACHLSMRPGFVGHFGNSGGYALNMAVQAGVSHIILVGFDMTIEHGRHWHRDHEYPLHNPRKSTCALWRENIDAVAPDIAALCIDVVNASPVSALTAYRKASLAESLCLEVAA